MKWYFVAVSILLCFDSHAARLKDLASIRGMKDNQLIGYGMVVGLAGTGDRSDFTESTLDAALKGLGVDPKIQKIGTKNSAAVIVTAILPPFSKVGTKLDVQVSSIGSAISLEGGSLMMTPLKGADGKVYSIAQGRIGITRRAERGTVAYQSMLSVTIPQGAILEKDVEVNFSEQKELSLSLNQPDFTTAARIAQKINDELGGRFATAVDPGSIEIILPYALEETPVELVARIETLEIEPDRKAKVIVNRKTGAVVLGENVSVFAVSLAHNNLKVVVRPEHEMQQSQRTPQSDMSGPVMATSEKAPPSSAANRDIDTVVKKEKDSASTNEDNSSADSAVPGDSLLVPNKVTRKVNLPNVGTSVAEIVTSLNEVGANAEDIVFIIQSLHNTGALVAEVDFK